MKALVCVIILILTNTVSPAVPANMLHTISFAGTKKQADFSKDTAAITSLVKKGFKFAGKSGKLEDTKKYIDSALAICDKKKIDIPPLLHLLQAEYGLWTDDLRSASEQANLALEKAEESGESEALVRTYMFFGEYNRRTGFYKESIENYDKGLSLAREKVLNRYIPGIYLGEADVFRAIEEFSEYDKQIQLMIDFAVEEKDTSFIILGYYLLGSSYCGDSASVPRRNFRKADLLLKKSLSYSLARKDTAYISGAYANSGWNFYLEKKYDSALFNYNTSLRYCLPGKREYTVVNSLGNMGTIYRDLRKYDLAIKYYKKAVALGSKNEDVSNLRWIYEDMSNLYLRLKDSSKAFKNYVLFKKYNDKFLIQNSNQGLADASVKYEADSHRQEVELLSLRLKNNRLLNYGFGGLIFLLVTISFLILRTVKLKNKRRISEMNRQISEVTQANLRQQMNPHFIFNTLNSIQYYMYQNDKLATNNYLTKFSNLMRKVLDNSQHTSVPLVDELNALRLYLELECIRFKDKFNFEIIVDEDVDPIMLKVPTMLIQPYVENSICHGLMPLEKKGFVKVEIKLKEEYLLCIIEDNGIGREASRERNLKSENRHNSLGTQITASRLELVNALYGTSLKTVYTDLKNNGDEPSGTRVEIHIPIIS